MIIALSEDCPLFQEQNAPHLAAILTTVHRGWHWIAMPTPRRLQHIMIKHLWSIYGDFLKNSYKQIPNLPARWVQHVDCAACDVEKLVSYYSSPAVVLVENVGSDGAFITMLIDKLRPALRRFLQRHPARVELRHGGGIDEVAHELRRLGADYARERPASSAPVHVLAVADSDAPSPGRPSDSATRVMVAADAVGATVHILSKRTIENYIPDGALVYYASRRRDRLQAVQTIVGLQGAARDHYPMKTGLRTDDLAVGLYPADAPLGLGLGDFIRDLLGSARHVVDEASLRERDAQGELTTLLSKLEGIV